MCTHVPHRHTNEQLTEDRLFSVDVAISDIPVGMLTGAGATPVSLPGLRALPTDSVKLAVPIALEVDGKCLPHIHIALVCRWVPTDNVQTVSSSKVRRRGRKPAVCMRGLHARSA